MYRVDEARCSGCGDCVAACPAGAISLIDGRAHMDQAQCVECGSCAEVCPQGAIVMVTAFQAAPAAIQSAHQGTVAPRMVPAASEALSQRTDVGILPAGARRSRIWPLVGSALVWAARELLPEALAVLRAFRNTDLPQTGRRSMAIGVAGMARRRSGHRYRWGRT